MMIDSTNRIIAKHDLVERSLNRIDEASASQDIFAICDVIIDQDHRVAELAVGVDLFSLRSHLMPTAAGAIKAPSGSSPRPLNSVHLTRYK